MTTLYDEEVINRHYERHIRRKIRQEVQQETRQEVQKKVQEESEKGIRALIETLHDLTLPQDAAIQAVAKKFNLPPEIAADKVSLYWE